MTRTKQLLEEAGNADASPVVSWKSEDGLLAFQFSFLYDDKGLLKSITITPDPTAVAIDDSGNASSPEPAREPKPEQKPETETESETAPEPMVFSNIASGATVAATGSDLKGNPLSGSFSLQLGLNFPGETDNGGIFFDLYYGEHGFHHLMGIFVTFATSIASPMDTDPATD